MRKATQYSLIAAGVITLSITCVTGVRKYNKHKLESIEPTDLKNLQQGLTEFNLPNANLVVSRKGDIYGFDLTTKTDRNSIGSIKVDDTMSLKCDKIMVKVENGIMNVLYPFRRL